jgi:Dolichyl-phosphate-mannose-protein mannosyltransferase
MVAVEARGPEVGAVSSLGRRLRLLLLGLVLTRGLVYLCVMPPFEGWDEYQHVACVAYVAETGRPAIFGKTEFPRSVLKAILPDFPQPKCALAQLDSRLVPMGYREYWARRVAGSSSLQRSEPAEAAVLPRFYESQHSWWYYALVSPLFRALGGLNDLRVSVGGLRLANVLSAVLAVWVVLNAVARRVRSPRVAAWTGLAIAAQPLFLINATRVSSDALGVLLATLVVALAIDLEERRMALKFGVMGVLAGLAILTKGTNWSLVPLLAGSWILVVVRVRPSAFRAVASASAMAIGLAVVVGPEIGRNLVHYGVPTAMQEAIVNHQQGRGLGALVRAAGSVPLAGMARWIWLKGVFIYGGWSFIEPAPALSKIYYWAVVAAITGWGGWLLRLLIRRASSGRPDRLSWLAAPAPRPLFESLRAPAIAVAFCASITGAMLFHATQSKLAWGESTTGAWYASAALPWFQVLLIGGALAWPSLWGRAIAVALVGSYVAGEQIMIWTRMLPIYSGGAGGWAALGRLEQLQAPFLSRATCLTALTGTGLLLTGIMVALARIATEDTAHGADGMAIFVSRFIAGRKIRRIAGCVHRPPG